MSIEKTWKDIDEQPDEVLASLLKPRVLHHLQTKSPLATIKKNMLINSIWALLIALGYLLIIIYFPFWQTRLCIGILFLFTVWAAYSTLLEYRNIRLSVPDNSLLEELERNYQNINRWIQQQKRAGIFIYPISAAGGFMLGGTVGAGKSVDEIMSKPVMWIALVIVTAILVPCGFYLAKWLTHRAFGRHLEVLKQNIEDLKK
ncbi:hypothetical protein [Sediminibacterium goheungense]|uniref:Uncharacterized protein n=1 Tax=Sediminibacterium goheungense TaxID=1086393 RepID=A0A4R6J370_9BACT|nr:hypothetical protein [Sediminibacterium goheungense]TDO29377.1 hypothetical protein BC659_1466 [Sediminibacterium goheungense]